MSRSKAENRCVAGVLWTRYARCEPLALDPQEISPLRPGICHPSVYFFREFVVDGTS
jgi:hypothetical protein